MAVSAGETVIGLLTEMKERRAALDAAIRELEDQLAWGRKELAKETRASAA